jgi:multisubunit Na+/H+ antiporter MnhB subunit
MTTRTSIDPLMRVVLGLALVPLAAALLWSVASMPVEPTGLTEAVYDRLDASGVQNPVTAVLLNFRGYDTFLELVVLTLAVLGIWSLPEVGPRPSTAADSPVLGAVIGLLVPLMIVVGGYLLWIGAYDTGGAFQSGATVAAAIVLLLVVGRPTLRIRPALVRAGAVLGGLVFLSVGLMTLGMGLGFLEYPAPWASAAIIGIEVAGAVSIAVLLASAFAGSPRALAGPTRGEEHP